MEGGKGERTMNRICSLAIGTVLMFSLATAAPQIAKTGTSAKGDKPAVEAQLKLLMHALDLTGEQQTRIERFLNNSMKPRSGSCMMAACRAKSVSGA
jgi:hypothetical protein